MLLPLVLLSALQDHLCYPEGCCCARLAYSAAFILFKHRHLRKLYMTHFLVKQASYILFPIYNGGKNITKRKEKTFMQLLAVLSAVVRKKQLPSPPQSAFQKAFNYRKNRQKVDMQYLMHWNTFRSNTAITTLPRFKTL